MTSPIVPQYRTKRVYEITAPEGSRQLRLSDRIVELGEQEFDWYQKVVAWLPSVRGLAELSRELEMDEAKVPKFIDALEKSGLLYRADEAPKTMTGIGFHRRFAAVLETVGLISRLPSTRLSPRFEKRTDGGRPSFAAEVRRQQKEEEMDRSAPVINRAIAVVGRATVVVVVLILGTPAAHADSVTYPTTCNNGGVPVSGKVVLTQDINCVDVGAGTVNGLTVGASNTTIFLNGFSIKCFDPRPSGPLPTVNSYKFTCQGDFQTSGGAFADTGIDTCGFSNVQIKGPGMIQGFSVGVRMRGRAPTNTTGPCGAGAANLTGPSASNVKVQKLNITGPDGRSDISDPLAGPRPKSFGILASNFIEDPTTCANWDSEDGHTHGNEIFGSSVENHVLGIALYNASRVNVHENFVHDNNSAGESTTCPDPMVPCVANSGTTTTITDGDTTITTECGFGQKCESHGIVVCANFGPFDNRAFACTTGVSRRNKIQNNLVVDNAQNSFGTSTAPNQTNENTEQVDGGLSLIGNALKNDVRNNTVLSNNGDGISVRNDADLNRFSSNTSLMNSTTQSCVVVGLTTTCTPRFWDLTFRGGGPNNSFNSSNRCLTQSPSGGEIPAGTCNANENTTWWQP